MVVVEADVVVDDLVRLAEGEEPSSLCFLFFFFFFFLIFFNETPPLRIKDMWWVVSVVGG